MSEWEPVALALQEVQHDLTEQNARLAEQNALLLEHNAKLSAVEEAAENFVPSGHFRWTIAAVVAAGLVVAGFAVDERLDRQRDRRESVANNRALCAQANDNRTRDNGILAALRADQDASRRAYTIALTPTDTTPPASRERMAAILSDLLGTLDGAPIPAEAPLLDCSGIGEGERNSLTQDAILNLTTTTSRP